MPVHPQPLSVALSDRCFHCPVIIAPPSAASHPCVNKSLPMAPQGTKHQNGRSAARLLFLRHPPLEAPPARNDAGSNNTALTHKCCSSTSPFACVCCTACLPVCHCARLFAHSCLSCDAALHHAAEGGHLDVVAKLVIAGCNVSRYDAQGMSPGHLAARHGYHEVMDKLLLAGFALDMQGGVTALHGSVGSTALHIAAQHGHQQVRKVPSPPPSSPPLFPPPLSAPSAASCAACCDAQWSSQHGLGVVCAMMNTCPGQPVPSLQTNMLGAGALLICMGSSISALASGEFVNSWSFWTRSSMMYNTHSPVLLDAHSRARCRRHQIVFVHTMSQPTCIHSVCVSCSLMLANARARVELTTWHPHMLTLLHVKSQRLVKAGQKSQRGVHAPQLLLLLYPFAHLLLALPGVCRSFSD